MRQIWEEIKIQSVEMGQQPVLEMDNRERERESIASPEYNEKGDLKPPDAVNFTNNNINIIRIKLYFLKII